MQRDTLQSKYHGQTAEEYDNIRENTPLWLHQQVAVERYLDAFPAGTRILDVPVGTGRFLEAYEARGFDVVGVDASTSMLERARARVAGLDLRVGNIFALEFPSDSFDVVVCIRFFNWLDGSDFQRAFKEIARVSKGAIIANIKTYTPFRELSIGRSLRQWKHRLGFSYQANGLVCHERRLVDDLIQSSGYALTHKTLALPGSEMARGIENEIYLLQKIHG